jgi:hypothetical protein
MHPSIDHPTLAPLLRYWQEKRGARALPARRDIDPLEMGPALLPHLLLGDLLDRGTRVRFRLVGTVVVKRLGFDPTGKYLAEEQGDWFDLMAALTRLVYVERAPVYAESLFTWRSNRRLETQHLLLPLTQDGPDPAIVLAGIAFRSTEPFPPTLRQLASMAQHRESMRVVLKHLPADEWVEDSGRNVA